MYRSGTGADAWTSEPVWVLLTGLATLSSRERGVTPSSDPTNLGMGDVLRARGGALDVHSRFVVAHAVDWKTDEVFRSRLVPQHPEILKWAQQLPDAAAVA